MKSLAARRWSLPLTMGSDFGAGASALDRGSRWQTAQGRQPARWRSRLQAPAARRSPGLAVTPPSCAGRSFSGSVLVAAASRAIPRDRSRSASDEAQTSGRYSSNSSKLKWPVATAMTGRHWRARPQCRGGCRRPRTRWPRRRRVPGPCARRGRSVRRGSGKWSLNPPKRNHSRRPACLDLDPADQLEIAGGHAQQSARARPGGAASLHARHEHEVQLAAPLGHSVAHGFEDGVDLRLQNLGGNARLAAGFAQDGGIGVPWSSNAGQRDLKARDSLHAGGKRIEVDAVAAAQQRAVDIEQIGILPVPGKPRLNCDARFVGLG